ncbi:hypothetical protein IEQ34_011276 [Dendrobium chrysotoxum]|uniref:PPC domain-containing protein n=1 Tax=Dendrobium chrysotoxum TaxID=161865 RepID=A0AAV7GYJ5_DENCH|nr:hypothetical protein IEQ34_011276 [Dendrobium chrysotoxum]
MSTCCPGSNNATAKRKRGGQPGSKNKPKIPVANCMPHAATLHPHVLEIHAGGDVAETIAAFARGCRNFGVCVLSASGPIAAAVLWEASPYPSTVTFHGSFNLLSFTATFLPGRSEGSLAVTLAGPHGQVVGGVVAGPVVAAGTVIVVAATFASSAFDSFGAVNNTLASMLPVFGGEEECGKSSAAQKCEAEKSERDMLKNTCCPGSNNATAKRKRGGQPGSKNKPKIPVANCMPHAATLHPHVLEIHAGGDVAETIAAFARGCRNFGVCVLSASGPIAAAVLWEASPYPSTLTFHGSFNLLSFTATFLPGRSEGSLAVTLAGPHGQVVGGVVAGPVVAAGTVIVVAATFASSAFDSFGAVNNTLASMLPVFGGEEECGKSSAAQKCEAEKSERDMLKKCLEDLDQFLDLPPEVDCVFIGDGASEEKTGLDGGGEGVDGNKLENYIKDFEHCLEVPADVGGAFNCVGGGVEEKTDVLDGDSGGEGEGDCFHIEQYLDLQMVDDDAFGGNRDGCGEHFALDAFRVSGACLPLY